MAAINQEFNLRFHDTALDNYVKKLEKSTVATDSQFSAMEKLAGGVKRAASAAYQSAAAVIAEQKAYNSVSDATRDLIGQLREYEAAIDSAFTDSQRDKAIDQLLSKMEKMGLAFTSSAAEAESADLVARTSLEKLAQAGDIAANSLAEVRFNDRVSEGAEKAEKSTSRLGSALGKAGGFAKKAVSSFMGFGKASNPVDKLSNKLTRTVVTLFSVRKVLGYINDAMERAPDKIGSAFTTLGSNVKDRFAGVMVSAMSGMQSGVEKLNAAMNSKSGQTLFRGLERAAELAGNAIGKLLEAGASLVEFLGDHATEVFTVAAIAAAFFAAQMLLSAGASIAAAWPLILIVGLAAALVVGLEKAGFTAEDIFEKIGQGAGWLYALVYNLVADAYNLFATFAEFFANVFNDPVAAVAHLFFDSFDVILSMVETAAKAIDKLTGSNLSAGISGFRSDLQAWVNKTYGENKIKIDRMEKIGYLDTANEWGNKAKDIASSFSLEALGERTAPELKAIKSDTSAIKKAVSLSTEDIKSLVDIAERRYVNQINLNSQTPIITVNGQNTGRTAEDRMALADAIKEILIEQTSSGSVVATAMP